MFLESGEFFWNSGIFIWTARAILDALRRCSPDLARVFDLGSKKFGTPAEQAFIDEAFPTCPSISIDYAVMEKAPNVYVETVSFGWSDLGTWRSLYENSPKNPDGNVTQNCNVMAGDSERCIFAVADSDKLVVVRGLKDYIIADSDDVLLIHPLDSEQRIRQVVTSVEERFGGKYL